ncbi:hypothetical protein M3685_07095 [Heyndrickxia oleronia]|uniref:Uncharacterized protein n=1 Tax=Heyndrickxia oleronia TaxID=38875 RepID=A0A8E2I7R6_9BACI|nr:hypothetical protein [Heyndrickxia oleronia]OJH19368.1 hypothetical protein BLX88_09285 [Bacillus obstructivus]MBU5210445.1 hypothetical protein [Heyndrickxia oleronia]MCM3453703.1 hypothetical protein [Heyndrickxia oleronia]MEC1374161.1 hypothetical protein [Heyndrickxia oleronia]OOP65780.1 hypothetical protein BWZ43_24430 [Heyndrickxia oleronia]
MQKQDIIFAWLGSILCILFFLVVNYLTNPDYLWFIYPTFFLLLWPFSMYSIKHKSLKLHSLFTSVILILFFITINYVHSPFHPWFLYASYPILWWPTLMFMEKGRKTVFLAIIGSLMTIVYYSFLNATISPQYPWAIYPSFVVLWWPLALFYAKKKEYYKFSIAASLLIILFFIAVNTVSSPNTIWAVYPIFIILWWPLSMYYFQYRRN